MRRYETPHKHAYYEITQTGINYQCYDIECFINGANLKEIDRISSGMSYIPILRCSECGTTYFGIETRNHEAEQEITEYAEEQKRTEEERAKLAERDNAEAIKEIRRQEAEQERILQEEANRHSAEKNGDIILPDILTL